jgi:hypothetical protein
MQRFLVALLTPGGKAKTLLTTRLMPRELDSREGCSRLELQPMTKEDSVAYFRARGVTEESATHVEIELACNLYGYNPLAITLLIGVALKDKTFMGNIHAIRDRDIRLVPTEPGRSHDILELTYHALPQALRDFVSRLAAFRSPVELEALKVVFNETGLVSNERCRQQEIITCARS